MKHRLLVYGEKAAEGKDWSFLMVGLLLVFNRKVLYEGNVNGKTKIQIRIANLDISYVGQLKL